MTRTIYVYGRTNEDDIYRIIQNSVKRHKSIDRSGNLDDIFRYKISKYREIIEITIRKKS